MPAFRNVTRRSGRLVNKPPTNYDDEGWEQYEESELVPSRPSSLYDLVNSPPASPSPQPSSSPSPPPSSRPSKKCTPNKYEEHIRRPKNAFILFRSHFYQEQKASGNQDQNDISIRAGKIWGSLSAQEKAPFNRAAAEEKAEHKRRYPQYAYAPGARKGGAPRRTRRCRPYPTRASTPPPKRKPRHLSAAVAVKSEDADEDFLVVSPENASRSQRASSSRLLSPSVNFDQEYALPALSPDSSTSGQSPAPEVPLSPALQLCDQFKTKMDLSIRPPSYHSIDHQFGYKPQVTSSSDIFLSPPSSSDIEEPVDSSSSPWDPESIHKGWDFVEHMKEIYDQYGCIDFPDDIVPSSSSMEDMADDSVVVETKPADD